MKKILIVDDDPLILRVMSGILSGQYDIVCASSGAEALALFDRERPDMVLSDLRMPCMDGYELRCRLRERSDVPFIFMTADESDESESRGLEAGAADYIRKPANADILLRRIGNIVQNLDRIHGLKEAASIDTMTGLLNKAASQREIGALCCAAPGALLMIDLDSFKLVNDIYGHDMGDRILIRFAQIVRDAIGPMGLAGRLGGDEFIAYLRQIQEEAPVREVVAYLNNELVRSAKEFMGEDMGIPLGASVGAVFVPAEGTDYTLLCRKADQALCRLKSGGKHGVSFCGTAHPSGQRQDIGIRHLRRILGERNPSDGAFLVDFALFQGIYRLFARLGNDVRKRTQLLQFSLQGERSGQEEAAEAFLCMLRRLLRQCDCVAQNGSSQFLVLLMDAGEDEGEWVRERIRERWASLPASARFGYDCEMECMGNGASEV